MNKTQRKALTQTLTIAAQSATTATSLVDLATIMVGCSSDGRTERWKDACELAGGLILDAYDDFGRVNISVASDAVHDGLDAMVAANK